MRQMRLITLITLTAALTLCLGTSALAQHAGTYRAANGMTMNLVKSPDGSYGGTIGAGPAAGQVHLTDAGNRLQGLMIFNGQQSPIMFVPQPDGSYTLSDGQLQIPMQRLGQPAQPEQPGQPQPQAPPQAPRQPQAPLPAAPKPAHAARPVAGWQTYRHPTGGTFQYPGDWRVVEQPGFLVLTPPDVQAGREVITAFGGAAQGARSAVDPQVGQFLDGAMRQLNPASRRVGEPSPIATQAGQGAVYTYEAQNPQTGELVTAYIYAVVADDSAVGFALVADDATLARRKPVVDRIVGTFTMGPTQQQQARPEQAQPEQAQPGQAQHGQAQHGQLDPALFGAWYGQNIHGGGGVIANNHFNYLFRPDGTIVSGSRGVINVALQDPNGVFNRGGANRLGENVITGRWSAGNGRLSILWDDGGRRESHYRVRGQTLEFRRADGKLIDFMER
ncbi:MAG: hypothetical protein ACFCVE_05305 [Phycisphaerae bacterium]